MTRRESRAAKRRAGRRQTSNFYGCTPIGAMGPEDVPKGAFQPQLRQTCLLDLWTPSGLAKSTRLRIDSHSRLRRKSL